MTQSDVSRRGIIPKTREERENGAASVFIKERRTEKEERRTNGEDEEGEGEAEE